MTMYDAKWSGALKSVKIMGALVIVSLSLLAAGQTARAELANPQEMKQVAENYLTEMVAVTGSWAGLEKPSIIASHDLYAGDTLVAVYYDISPKGFVLVPVLKEMVPVKAYSDDCNLGEIQDDSLLILLRDELSRRLSLYAATYGSLDASQPKSGEAVFGQSQRLLWDRYTVTADEFKAEMTARATDYLAAGPLLTSSWSQGAPYNDSVPNGYSGRCVVGCTATALAAILDFWQWPLHGYGTETYEWGGDHSCGGGSTGGQTLSAVLSDPYDWANMADNCSGGCTSAQRAALAELSHDVGVVYHMDYGSCASGADMTPGLKQLPYRFLYSTDIRINQRVSHTLESWYLMIKEEIDNGRPIHYGINSHSIVCDGYRQVGSAYQYHMNYGWGGSSTAWYTLDSLYCYWISGSVCPSEEDYMLTHIHPQYDPALELAAYTYDDADHDRRCEAGELVKLRLTVRNAGDDATNVTAQLSTSDPYITVNSATAGFGASMAWNAQAVALTDLSITVSPSCPNPRKFALRVDLTADGGYVKTDTILLVAGTVTGFSDGAESGQGYWRHSRMTSGYADEWHMETYRAHSGATSWKAGGTGANAYEIAEDAALVTPPILLAPNATLSFWHWIDAEVDVTPGQAWDGGIVMISSSDGTWQQLQPVGGYPYQIVDNFASPFAAGTGCLSGTQGWTKVEFDLSAYSGIVRLMFRFGTDGAVNEEGWYIDDVLVSAGACCTGPSRGNLDDSPDNLVTMGDLTVLIDHLFISLSPLSCPAAGNVDLSADNLVTMGDLTVMIDNLFISLNPLPACP
jgi:hypothetical protein